MNKLSTKLVVAIGIGAALYGILGLWGFLLHRIHLLNQH